MNSTAHNLNKFLTIPFVDGGRSFTGADCWGLVMLIFREFGINVPDFEISCSLTQKINETIDQQRSFWIKIDKPKIPCLVLMRTSPTYPKLCNHLGVYFKEGFMIHTFRKMGVNVTSIDHPFFKHTIEGFYVPRI